MAPGRSALTDMSSSSQRATASASTASKSASGKSDANDSTPVKAGRLRTLGTLLLPAADGGGGSASGVTSPTGGIRAGARLTTPATQPRPQPPRQENAAGTSNRSLLPCVSIGSQQHQTGADEALEDERQRRRLAEEQLRAEKRQVAVLTLKVRQLQLTLGLEREAAREAADQAAAIQAAAVAQAVAAARAAAAQTAAAAQAAAVAQALAAAAAAAAPAPPPPAPAALWARVDEDRQVPARGPPALEPGLAMMAGRYKKLHKVNCSGLKDQVMTGEVVAWYRYQGLAGRNAMVAPETGFVLCKKCRGYFDREFP
ncbi:hypothetical protein HYH03_009164 [Edaphochlamys debaryana]|uniref:Uncharacterized protein n=1 Tax=Edaphochlamys debaryana TaxID=47281 RepID=A0A835Y7N2_9CHLO|nr:hypothetical protein HYH03_009164 [Edaphochlamys debaryana]|eukprot:KAG2492499.1 hypothetical protein HYH03_009164 [Edaphochlamys debaryana]